jgi:hypothetical protein
MCAIGDACKLGSLLKRSPCVTHFDRDTACRLLSPLLMPFAARFRPPRPPPRNAQKRAKRDAVISERELGASKNPYAT